MSVLLFEAWLGAGAEPKEGWAMQALGFLGDDDVARKRARAGAKVKIAHALGMSDADKKAWSTVFADYEILQPFEQLGRRSSDVRADERSLPSHSPSWSSIWSASSQAHKRRTASVAFRHNLTQRGMSSALASLVFSGDSAPSSTARPLLGYRGCAYASSFLSSRF